MSRHREPPGLLSLVESAAGPGAADALAREFGGRRVYLRTQVLAPLIGDGAARQVIGAIGAGRHEVPKGAAQRKGARDLSVVEAAERGESCPDLARRFCLSERHIRRILSAHIRNNQREHMTMEAHRTALALDAVTHDGRTYRRGEVIEGLSDAQAADLIEAGVAAPAGTKLPTPPALPARPFADDPERNLADKPVSAWLWLCTAIKRARTGNPVAELPDEAAREFAAEWADPGMDGVDRSRLWRAKDHELFEALAASGRR